MAARVRRRRSLIGLALLALSAAGCRQGPQPEPAAQIAAVLEHCHGPLRGSLARSIVELRESPDGGVTQVIAELPARMRVKRPCGRVDLLLADRGVSWSPDSAPRDSSAPELAELIALRRALRALLLLPLYEVRSANWIGPLMLELVTASGEAWRLELDNDRLRPRRLASADADVRFVTYIDTGFTRLPRETGFGGLPYRHAAIVTSGIALNDALFQPDRGDASPANQTITVRRNPTELPQTPQLQELPARRFLVLDDPGDWDARAELLRDEARQLYDAGQVADGLPVYATTGTRAMLLIPFKPDPDRGGAALQARAGQEILERAATRAAVFAPPPGVWDEILRSGRASLTEFAAGEGLRTDGPLWITPFPTKGSVPASAERERIRARLEIVVVPR